MEALFLIAQYAARLPRPTKRTDFALGGDLADAAPLPTPPPLVPAERVAHGGAHVVGHAAVVPLVERADHGEPRHVDADVAPVHVALVLQERAEAAVEPRLRQRRDRPAPPRQGLAHHEVGEAAALPPDPLLGEEDDAGDAVDDMPRPGVGDEVEGAACRRRWTGRRRRRRRRRRRGAAAATGSRGCRRRGSCRRCRPPSWSNYVVPGRPEPEEEDSAADDAAPPLGACTRPPHG